MLARVDRSLSGDGDDPPAVPAMYRGTEGRPGPVLFTLDVDGERFAIRRAADGGTAYDWLNGPNEGYGFWAVIEKETGEFLGWFHFRPYEDGIPGEVDLGYRLRKSAWGKGYATEGSRALIRKGFTEVGVQRVVAQAMAVNQASRRVMEKAGLKLVRTFHQPWPYRIEGDEFGDVEYALDRTGWQQLEGPSAG